jgi:hypothetical protein
MSYRGIFLADGPSDLPLSEHLQALCFEFGADVALTAIDPHLLHEAKRTVEGRLLFLKRQGATFDIVFIHRDAESRDPEPRFAEVKAGAHSAGVSCPIVPVVPVRMTEAWLLLNERAIRDVAGRPGGRAPLHLPTVREIETIADPKARLAEALLVASETFGRRKDRFVRDFGQHRSLLLRRLDTKGEVTELAAWRRLRTDIEAALGQL